jgi:hypothetical protein
MERVVDPNKIYVIVEHFLELLILPSIRFYSWIKVILNLSEHIVFRYLPAIFSLLMAPYRPFRLNNSREMSI